MEWKYSEDRKRIVIDPPKQRLRITGHRFASVLGLNAYQSSFGSWAEITKLVKLPFEDNKYLNAGRILEPKIIEYVSKRLPNIMSIEEYYGKNIERYKWNNFIDDSDIFGGIIDAVSTKNDMKTLTAIIECKTSSKAQEWDKSNVKLEYLLQGALYSYLKGLDRVLFACTFLQELDYNHPENVIVSEENTILVVKKLKDIIVEMPNGDYITFDEAIKYCEEWWKNHVETGISPEFDEKKDKAYLDIIRQSQPINDSNLEELCDRAKQLSEKLELLKDKYEINEIEKQIKAIESNIKSEMLNNLKDGETKISCKQYKLSGTISNKFDDKLFKEEHPNTYDKYCKQTVTYRLTKTEESEEK